MKTVKICLGVSLILAISSCAPPAEHQKNIREKHNYIILLDLSDRLIVQPDQPARDKEIISALYTMFEQRVKENLYVRSRDEIKVVIAPQRGSGLRNEIFENEMYVNMDNIMAVHRRAHETQRRDSFLTAMNELYGKAVFSNIPEDYYGADIWKYFYEDLEGDMSGDTLTRNFLFILTDGYPIVGSDRTKLRDVNRTYPDLEVILMEASPRDKDLEWDHIQEMWTEWFDSMDIQKYTFIKRKAISKEVEQAKALVEN